MRVWEVQAATGSFKARQNRGMAATCVVPRGSWSTGDGEGGRGTGMGSLMMGSARKTGSSGVRWVFWVFVPQDLQWKEEALLCEGETGW